MMPYPNADDVEDVFFSVLKHDGSASWVKCNTPTTVDFYMTLEVTVWRLQAAVRTACFKRRHEGCR